MTLYGIYLINCFTLLGLQPKTFYCTSEDSHLQKGYADVQALAGNCFEPGYGLCSKPNSDDEECDIFQPCSDNGTRVIYGDFDMSSTIVTEFDLICDESYRVHHLICF